jgi:hypothetical protein
VDALFADVRLPHGPEPVPRSVPKIPDSIAILRL